MRLCLKMKKLFPDPAVVFLGTYTRQSLCASDLLGMGLLDRALQQVWTVGYRKWRALPVKSWSHVQPPAELLPLLEKPRLLGLSLPEAIPTELGQASAHWV